MYNIAISRQDNFHPNNVLIAPGWEKLPANVVINLDKKNDCERKYLIITVQINLMNCNRQGTSGITA
jgi:hypothetical protein